MTQLQVVPGKDGGYVMEDAGFCCYNYLTNSCHQAANCGVNAGNDGIISCTGATSGPYGHTVVWDRPDSTRPGHICIAEPQLAGSQACCFDQANTSGTPNLSSAAAQACIKQLCDKQYKDGGAVAMDGGWDTGYLDCAQRNSTRASCEACCDTNANAIPASWGDAAVNDRENYRRTCKQSCAGKP